MKLTPIARLKSTTYDQSVVGAAYHPIQLYDRRVELRQLKYFVAVAEELRLTSRSASTSAPCRAVALPADQQPRA